MSRIIRVFPRKTRATPDDELAYFGPPDMFAEAHEVHVSVTFTYDKPEAERLAEQWRHVAPVKIGGVAYGDESLEFIPGRYIKPGYTITSRGCPRRCWFCGVWKKWPEANPLPIYDGWNVLDDNLLACPRWHVEEVFKMLRRQKLPKNGRIEFTGGLEALALQPYQVDLLAGLTPRPNMFFAYDPGDEPETLLYAARSLLNAGFTAESHRLRASAECLVKRHVLLGAARAAEAAGNMAVATRSRTLASNLELMASDDPATRERGKLWYDKNRADLDAYLNKTGRYAGGGNSKVNEKL